MLSISAGEVRRRKRSAAAKAAGCAAKKTSYSLQTNCSALVQAVGIDRVGFLTLTLAEHLRWDNADEWKEAQRRFNSFCTGYLSKRFGVARIVVVEPQRSGRIHWHLLVDCGEDVRTGLDFEALAEGNYSSASVGLRRLWAELRRECAAYRFGRSELLPLKSCGDCIGRYVGKYLDPSGVRSVSFAGFRGRRLRYSKGAWRVCGGASSFAWASSTGREWRRAVEAFAGRLGCDSLEALKLKVGKNWAWRLRGVQNEYGFGD